MPTPRTPSAMITAFEEYHNSILAKIANSGGGGATAPGKLTTGANTLSRQAPIREYIGNFSDNATIALSSGFQINDAIKVNAFVASGKALIISSSEVIEVMGGLPGTSHTLAGKITRTFILQKTSTGWDLYI